VQRTEPLVHAHGIVGRQHGDRGAHTNALGTGRDRRKHDLWSRDGKVRAVVLPDADEVEPDSVGEHCFGDDVADALGL
jgi:hypothetical protein